MDPATKVLLCEWGKWSRQWGFSLGVKPAGSVLGCSESRFEEVAYSDDEMERVGRAVAALRNTNFEYYEIINDYFRSNKSIRDLSVKYGVSFRKARDDLAQAVSVVARELSCLELAA